MSDIEQRLARLSPAKRELLLQRAAQLRAEQGALQPRSRPARIPLTFGQRRLWLVDRLSPGTAAYNVPVGVWLQGPVDREALQAAVQSLMDRHEILRTVYDEVDGEPWQRIVEQMDAPWREARVEGVDREARRAAAMAIAVEEVARPFDLKVDAMMRAALVQSAADEFLFVLTFHHIAADGWSLTTLLDELRDAYAAQISNRDIEVTPPRLQLADYALWEQERFGGEALQSQLDYWKTRLAGAPPATDLPADRARPPIQTFQGAQVRAPLPAQMRDRVEAFARTHGATASMVFLAAYQALMCRYTGQDDIVVGMGVAGRSRPELETVIGFFVNTIALRSRVDADAGFSALVEQVRENTLAGLDHADAPLDRVLDALSIPRGGGFTPFAQAMYFYQSYPPNRLDLHGVQVEMVAPAQLAARTAQGDITLFVEQSELVFEYATDLFDRERIERMAGHLLTLLEAAISEPTRVVRELPLLTDVERDELARWNATERELPANPTLTALLDAQAARTPDAVALRFDGRDITYRELHQRADMLAAELARRGVQPGVLVGLYVDRTVEMLIGLLGIVKAGGAYVPMDPAYPRDRLEYMLEISGAGLVVTHAGLDVAFDADVSAVVADANAPIVASSDSPITRARAHDPAYVIFTSGSTGRPKGVEIRQRSAVNLLRSVAREPGLREGDVVCAISTLSFDIALFELVLPLTVGATVLLADRDTARDGASLRRLIERERVTVLQATPATWRMLLEVGWQGDPTLKIISTGEALPRELARRLLPCGSELWNLYGPTETTVYSALCRVEDEPGPILVGRPVDNTQIHIVDRHFQPVPAGVPGELLIGGDGLANGYRGRPDLTAEKFIPDMVGDRDGARVYRSGDLALWRWDGRIEVIGRIDHQIKLRGFRIELGEIEALLATHAGVTQAVVHCREDRPGDPRLIAYVTTDAGGPSVAAMRDRLKATLPDYMVPSAFVVLDAFPLTPNGKVDRRALPAPDSAGNADAQTIAPRTAEERELHAIWGQLLGTDHLDVRSNFFDLGGHSLLATRMLARVQQNLGVELPLRALFEAPTLEQLAARVAVEREQLPLDELDALLAGLEAMSDDEASRLAASGDRA